MTASGRASAGGRASLWAKPGAEMAVDIARRDRDDDKLLAPATDQIGLERYVCRCDAGQPKLTGDLGAPAGGIHGERVAPIHEDHHGKWSAAGNVGRPALQRHMINVE